MQKNILIIPGDGIGGEVTVWGKAVLQKMALLFNHDFQFQQASMGHAAIESTGNPLPDETLKMARESDAILFGAVGHLKYDQDPSLKIRPEQGLLKIRKELGLYANLRPIVIFDQLLNASSLRPEVLQGTDILFFRELTGDAYFGEKMRSTDGNSASDLMIYHRYEIERIARKAFESARSRRKKLCSVDKANVLESSRLWRGVVQQMAGDYPDVNTTHMFVDNAAMQLIKDPKQFDVVLTSNLFGDILTDEASQIAGSMGMLASASIGNGPGFFEPIHGSAHDIAGKNLANPIASILSAALMLDIGFGMKNEAKLVIAAIKEVLNQGFRTIDISEESTARDRILGTIEMGEQIIKQLSRITPAHKLTMAG